MYTKKTWVFLGWVAHSNRFKSFLAPYVVVFYVELDGLCVVRTAFMKYNCIQFLWWCRAVRSVKMPLLLLGAYLSYIAIFSPVILKRKRV